MAEQLQVCGAGWCKDGADHEVFVTILRGVEGIDESTMMVHVQFKQGYAVFRRCEDDTVTTRVNDFLAEKLHGRMATN